jgi:hypothetical protein
MHIPNGGGRLPRHRLVLPGVSGPTVAAYRSREGERARMTSSSVAVGSIAADMVDRCVFGEFEAQILQEFGE